MTNGYSSDSDIECLALATAMCNVMPKTMSSATSYGNDSKSDRKAEEVMIELVVENFDFQISNLKSQISKKGLSQNSLYPAIPFRTFKGRGDLQ